MIAVGIYKRLKISLLIFVMLFAASLAGQETGDNKKPQRVQIIYSDKMSTIDMDSTSMTILVGNVVLEHNRVVMSCDSAEWFPTGIFNSFGNVVVVSAAAEVTGDMMEYNGNTSMAKVRGKVVYLRDSSSTLRTNGIDFNTKDEICYFENEGTIKDTAQLLESRHGYYYSHRKEFEFIGRVQSETNEYLLQSDSMMYNTETKIFTFYDHTHIWAKNRDGYLYCDRGTYDSENDRLFFTHNSYMMSKTQEVFADSIYYENKSGKGKLYSNVQVVDTAQGTIALSDFADFDMNRQDFVMRKNPSILIYDESNDTVFMRADTLLSFNLPINAVQAKDSDTSDEEIIDKNRTIMLPELDSIKLKRKLKSDSIRIKDPPSAGFSSDSSFISPLDSLTSKGNLMILSKGDSILNQIDPIDTEASDSIKQIIDSILINAEDNMRSNALLPMVANDSISKSVISDTVRADSTYRQIFGIGNVKIFRRDLQAKCDSVYFNTLDSIWKMYKSPVVWDSVKMQLFSDSIRVYIKNGSPDRAEFESNAMIIIPEGDPDSTSYFNQIKGRNMVARFREKEIHTLHVAGNVHTLFFSISDMMMNDTEAASMRINFNARKVQRVVYFTDIKGDNNPLIIVPEEDTKLAGFNWLGHLRPKSRDEVLGRLLKMSARAEKMSLPRPDFPITSRINEIERSMQQEPKVKK
jgi:lipopolysaccharide export system protein LptA